MLWQNELHHNITTIEELSKYYHFTEDEKNKLNRLLEQFPMSITRYYLSLINKDDPHDPIARIAVPSLQEFHLEGSFDTSGEKENTKVVGLQHKYAQTALILSTNQCASYCRHCFRRRLVGLSGDEIMKRFDAIENYVAEHKEINNILISGGDSLCQDNHMIKRYLDTFSKMEHLDFIRFGTRIPVVFPQRIINDPELVTMFREYNNIKPIYIVTHFNHPREITKESTLAVKLLRDAGIIVKNQTVLLKGVNDDADTLAQLLQVLVEKEGSEASFSGYLEEIKQKGIPGLVFLDRPGNKDGAAWGTFAGGDRQAGWPVYDTGIRPPMDMNRIPFPYGFLEMEQLEHRIIYYESSRGCPFSCAYCLSSIDKSVRFRSLERVKEELSFFLNARVPQVKFVDRTFNCKKSHAMAIWQFIRENDNGITNFHFEIAADLLDQEELNLLSSMRPGLIQLEIGVQSTNPDTLSAIRRKTDIAEIRKITHHINSRHNIHQHLDLIAGLPHEDLSSFRKSFNEVYDMEPEQLQLGFLKVLKGSYMEEMIPACELLYSSSPPYEVLSTRWLSYGDILELKAVEEMVEVYYNSRQFTCTLEQLRQEFDTPYEMFLDLAGFYQKKGYGGVNHSRLARYEILWEQAEEMFSDGSRTDAERKREQYRDALMTDLYLRENIKSRPSFARNLSHFKEQIRRFFRQEEDCPCLLPDYTGYDSRQLAKMAHLEPAGDGSFLLFDYKNRDPLTYNARMVRVEIE